MEREASLLRCSKLSSYAEFNRMVQAISRRSSGGSSLSSIPGINNMQGTSAEYYFYTTLSTMLRQVISNNSNPSSQRDELEMIYQWFCLNRPLIGRKTHPRSHRPSLSMMAPRSPLETVLDRPQTAPAALYQPHPPPDPIHQRPYTSPLRANKSFTSSFMSRSLSKDLDLVGRPLDHLVDLSRSAKQPLFESHSAASSQERRQRSKSTSARSSLLSVVNIPASNSLSGQPQRPSSVNIGAVFALAPSVAAQMTLDREMQRDHDARVRRVLSTAIGVTNRQTMNPTESTFLERKHGTKPLSATEVSLAKEKRPLLSPDQITIQRQPSLGREDVTQPVFEANPSADGKNMCSDMDVSDPFSNPSVKEATSGEQDITLQPSTGTGLMASQGPGDTRGSTANGTGQMGSEGPGDANGTGQMGSEGPGDANGTGQMGSEGPGDANGTGLMASQGPGDTRGSTANGTGQMGSEGPADSRGSIANGTGQMGSEGPADSRGSIANGTGLMGSQGPEDSVIETKPTPIRVTSITFSAQKMAPVSGGSRTSVSSHMMQRVPTPMSVVSISFPSSDEHPQTSHGNRQASCTRNRTSITAAGFRYRPKTVPAAAAARHTGTLA